MIHTSINLFRSLQITPDSMPPPPRTPSPIFCDTSTPLQDTDQPDLRKLVYSMSRHRYSTLLELSQGDKQTNIQQL